MTPQPLSKLSAQEIQRLKEQQIEQERMQDVLLVLDQLFRREKVTAKLVIDCLYDVGCVNLINQKIHPRSLQQVTKGIARISKPLCRQVALMWFLDNCPKLTANWLHSLVVFTDEDKPGEAATEVVPVAVTQEVQRLRTQARLSAGVAIVAIAALIGTVFYTSSRLQVMPWQLLEPTAATTVNYFDNQCQ
jgi:hypothetical protein